MPVNPLPSPRHNWENPRDIFDFLVDENLNPIVLDNLQEIALGQPTRQHNSFTPITHPA